MIHQCIKYAKRHLNPIIDWSNEEVWEFIREYEVPYCELYDKGYKRLGCIGCPMSTHQLSELNSYPKYKEAYIRAFGRMLQNRKYESDWKTGEEVFDWWVNLGSVGGKK